MVALYLAPGGNEASQKVANFIQVMFMSASLHIVRTASKN